MRDLTVAGKAGLAVLFAVVLQSACVSTSPAPPPERRDPSTGEPYLEGSRYETMRVLARRLAELAEAVRQDALAERRPRAGEDGFSRLSELADRAGQFHRALENYSDPPRYVRAQVRDLDALVRDIDGWIRSARYSDRTQRSWRDVLDVMDRMSRVASGENVDLPPAYPDSDSREGPVFPSGPTSPSDDTWRSDSGLSQRELEELRRLARELAVRATLASEGADRSGSAFSDAQRRLLRDLEDFRLRARELQRRTDSGTLDRRDLRATVDRLSEDARRIDREMRDRGDFTGIWGDWTEVLLLVRRMADLVRA